MLNKGRSEEELFTFLAKKKSEDLDHAYILSSMCTIPHAVAVRAHCMFMETNLGDPGLFPGTTALEQLLIRRFAEPLPLPRRPGGMPPAGVPNPISRHSGLHGNAAAVLSARTSLFRNPPISRSRKPAISSALRCAGFP